MPGTHNFEQENREQLYASGDFFIPATRGFARAEIPSQAEFKTAAELHVPLPADNLDFHRLAQVLVTSLPRPPACRPIAQRLRVFSASVASGAAVPVARADLHGHRRGGEKLADRELAGYIASVSMRRKLERAGSGICRNGKDT